MSDLVARTGRHQQRYQDGFRLIAGCIPFKYDENSSAKAKEVEVLMINSLSGPGLLFPKGGWENDETMEEAALREAMEEAGVRGELKEFLGCYEFKSKTHVDEFSPEGKCKAAMFALLVEELLPSWPENTRERKWVKITEAPEKCRHPWMKGALQGFCKWHADKEDAS
ncbi:hypothetical protein QJS10_CPB04g00704 [Acorus calamus]|uniref:Nudix hydrolase domain-containing protein n=1 Tax=Acorus calamus TaxID=4465 RepID=A0AAV9F059_ACOCL|nr:hypothetical protein QJS10_CPB04g00704 [Acorus calamus]